MRVHFLYKKKTYRCIFRAFRAFPKSALNCLQLKIILMLKWHILEQHVLVPFRPFKFLIVCVHSFLPSSLIVKLSYQSQFLVVLLHIKKYKLAVTGWSQGCGGQHREYSRQYCGSYVWCLVGTNQGDHQLQNWLATMLCTYN